MNRSAVATALLTVALILPIPSQAVFFFFIPGKLIDAVGDAITGSEGENCISANAKVGDTIQLTNGARATVKSVSGTSMRCTQPEYPIRAKLEVSPSPMQPPAAINTKAGIDLPDGWERRLVSDDQRATGMFFHAFNPTTDVGLALSSAKREGVTDMAAFAAARRAGQASRLTMPVQSEITPISINNLPAWRFHVAGDVTGSKYTYLVTVIDAGTEIVTTNSYTTALAFDDKRVEMEKLSYRITGLGGAKPVTQNPEVIAAPSASASAQPPAPAASPPTPSSPALVPTSASTSPSPSAAERLRELNALRKEGLITEKDYEEKKKKILDAM